jgi:hypothetical protein
VKFDEDSKVRWSNFYLTKAEAEELHRVTRLITDQHDPAAVLRVVFRKGLRIVEDQLLRDKSRQERRSGARGIPATGADLPRASITGEPVTTRGAKP